MIRLLIFPLLFALHIGNANELIANVNYKKQNEQENKITLLTNIESKIYESFTQSLRLQDNIPLLNLSIELEEVSSTDEQEIIIYWRSYLQFYASIYFLKTSQREAAKNEVDKGISWLNEIQTKNSEEYALLSMLQGFSIQFKWTEARSIADEAKNNALKAIELDSTNLRAHYVYASNNYYSLGKSNSTKEVEKHLQKAITLPAQKVANNRLPSWGKEESFEVLVKLYIEKEEWELAKKYYQEGITEFPNSYTINQLAEKLVGK